MNLQLPRSSIKIMFYMSPVEFDVAGARRNLWNCFSRILSFLESNFATAVQFPGGAEVLRHVRIPEVCASSRGKSGALYFHGVSCRFRQSKCSFIQFYLWYRVHRVSPCFSCTKLKETIRNLSPSLAAFSVTFVPWVPWLKGHGKILKPNRYPEAARGCPQMAGIWKILEDLFFEKTLLHACFTCRAHCFRTGGLSILVWLVYQRSAFEGYVVNCHNHCFECSRMYQWAISAWWIFRLTSALAIGPLVAHSVGKIELCVASKRVCWISKALLGICHVTCASQVCGVVAVASSQ